jgi:hypothetical protein
MKTQNTPTYHIFIGYDDREHIPFQVAKHSLESLSTVKIKVHKLDHLDLRTKGLFTREWKIEKNGQYVDTLDQKPFSTQFSFTRFLVPELWRSLPDSEKSPLVMFVDCDFVWLKDIGLMFQEIEEKRLKNFKSSPVYCVHHDYTPPNSIKMDNKKQEKYNFKLWSSMMVFDMEHKDNEHLIPELVNTETGRFLHSFGWCTDTNKLGSIHEQWNFLPGYSEKNTGNIGAIHYTEGGPNFPHLRQCRYASAWWDAYQQYLRERVLKISFNVEALVDGV